MAPLDLGRARSRGPFQRLEDRRLGDPIATFEVRRLGVQGGDRRQRVGEMVEHEHQIGLDEGGHGDPDGIALGQRHAWLERRHRVVASAPTAPPVNRGMPSAGRTRRRGTKSGSRRAGPRPAASRPADRRIGRDRDRPRLDPGQPVAHVEQAPRPTPGTSSVPVVRRPRPTRAGRPARRRRDGGRLRSASRGRLGAWRAAGSCRRSRPGASSGQAQRIGGVMRPASENAERPFVSGTNSRAFRGATLIRRCRTLADRRVRVSPRFVRSALPVSLALCAGAYWRLRLAPPRVRSGGSRVHSPSSSSRLTPAAGSLGRRATGTRPDHSPFFVMVRGVWPSGHGPVKQAAVRGSASPAQRRTRAAADSADIAALDP